ncbi:MAG: GGDEF domain-containing protein [Gemmatimonadota bacterium]|nr:GGDEF domain-containing protein [Gemmatimonadota bacterium]
MTRFLQWILPGGFVTGAAYYLAQGGAVDGVAGRILDGYPPAVYGGAFLLGIFFHRSRVIIGVAALASLRVLAGSGRIPDPALALAAGSLALALALLMPSTDRGVRAPAAWLQGIWVVVFVGITLLVTAQRSGAGAETLLTKDLIPGTYLIPEIVVLAFAVSAVPAIVTISGDPGPVEKGMFWSLVCLLLAVIGGMNAPTGGLFLLAGATTLGLSVLETSYAMAYRDELTGLPGRRALMRDLQALGTTYSAAMVDVDHFKQFNDRHGHDVGDQVLRMVGTRLARVRGGGKAYRYGGEEFTILYPGKTREDTLELLDAVRQDIEDSSFTVRHWPRPRKKPQDDGKKPKPKKRSEKRLSVTVSIGVAEPSNEDSTPDDVLKKADKALYRAKKKGRNQVSK